MVKFLVIRFSSIGDIVLTSPVVRCLKNQVKGAEIHFLTKKQFEPVVRNNPYIDKVWILDGKLEEVVKEIKEAYPDYIIDLHHNLRTSLVKKRLKLAAFSFNKLNFEKWLIVNFNINRLPALHIVDRYLETVKAFDVQNDQEGLDYFLDPSDSILPGLIAKDIPQEFHVLVIGAQHFTKKMPPSMLADLCGQIKLPVVIIGDKTDSAAAKEILDLAGNLKIIDTTGKLTINQSAYLVQQSRSVITHDTGMMHIAAAFKKKIISIWGNTIPEFGMYPYLPGNDSKIFEVKGLSCRPCSKIGFKECPKKHFRCMVDQDLESIAAAVNN